MPDTEVDALANLARIFGLDREEVLHLSGCLVCSEGFRCDLNPELIRQAIALIREGTGEAARLRAQAPGPARQDSEPEWMSDPDLDPRDRELRERLHENAKRHGTVPDPRRTA